MVLIITDGDEERLRAIAPHSVVTLIFVSSQLTPRVIKELAPIAGSKLVLGGTAILAETMEAAFERL